MTIKATDLKPRQLSSEEILKLYKGKYGVKAANVLNRLAKQENFISAMNSEAGRHIMSKLIDRAHETEKLFTNEALDINADINKLSPDAIRARLKYQLYFEVAKDLQEDINSYYRDRIH